MAAHLYDDYLRHFPPLPSLLIPYPRPYNNNNYNSGSCIDDLCDTLLELIITRLVQWRHLVTCKLVSKRWNSIISNPYFSRGLTNKYTPFTLILRNRSTDDCLISEHPYFRTHKLGLNDIFPNSDPSNIYNIVACHNDILVLSDRFAFKIGNPLTKQFILVPRTTNRYDCKVGFAGIVDGVSTIDVPNPKNNVIGFRIIRIRNACYENNLTGQIYSSVTGNWKTYNVNDLGFEFSTSYLFNHRNLAVTWNNRVHWRGESNKILVMDPFFVDEIVSYCVLNLPSEFHEDSVLGSCQNRLRIAQFESNPVTPRIKVWEFDEDDELMNWGGNSMAKLRLVINFALKPRLYDPVFSRSEVLLSMSCLGLKNEVICCHPNDADIVYVMYRNKLVECDVGERRLSVIRDCSTSWSYRYMLVHPLMAP